MRRAEQLLALTKTDDAMLKLAGNLHFPGKKDEPLVRLDALEKMMDKVGTNYQPNCLADCGMSKLCRGRAYEAGLASLCGSSVVRLLPGIRTLPRAAELATGATPAATEVHAATALVRANSVYQRVLTKGAVSVSKPCWQHAHTRRSGPAHCPTQASRAYARPTMHRRLATRRRT